MHLPDAETSVAQDTSVFPRSVESVAKVKEEQLELIREPAKDDGSGEAIALTIPKDRRGAVTMMINPTFLRNLAAALGDTSMIRLQVIPDDQGVVRTAIRATGRDGAYGAIMPMVDED